MINPTIGRIERHARTSVELWQGEGERPTWAYCEWMPYQLAKAATTST